MQIIYYLSIHQLLSKLLAEFAIILDSLFTGVANTNSTPTRWEGRRVAMKWRAKAMSSLKPAKLHPLVPFLPTHYV